MDDFQLNISSAPLPKPPKKKVFVPREDPSAAAQAPQKHASRSARREQGNANGDRPTQYVPQAKAAAGAAAGAAPAPRKRDPTKGFVSSLFSGAGHEQPDAGAGAGRRGSRIATCRRLPGLGHHGAARGAA
ncbi:hypothetical protein CAUPRSCDRAFT_12417 [Caulochytrium protostelioides]|uniref:Uncharacterized protein n=1 Tax=Caulochytrium protostelioides TaxID=1555241 RepID=A0A4P9WRX7_9FUNG|nr:hypothetical protein CAUPRSCDRAFT_12417 [Caulochytrium protostelioides]